MKMKVNLEIGYFADFIGFIIPTHFVIGFGLDYNEHFRELPHLCKINKHGIETFKITQRNIIKTQTFQI
jgi:hypoxanthine phosphoribosyltransferase